MAINKLNKNFVSEQILTAQGMNILPSEITGEIEWTYPNYNYNTDELNNLLNSDKWSNKEEII